MADAITLRVITPDRIAVDTTASAVVVPATDGETGILARHAPMVTALDAGPLRYTSGGRQETLFVSGGFAEVRDNTVRIVTEAGERADDIDEARAREAEKRARERLAVAKSSTSTVDLLRAEASLRRALQRLKVKGSR